MSSTLDVINPSTGERVRSYPKHSAEEVTQLIAAAHDAWQRWRQTDLDARAPLMRRAAQLLRARSQTLAALMATEMGKPVSAGHAEVNKCAWVCDHYAEHAARYLASEPIEADARASYVAYRPLGVVLAVMPWNFPLWQVFRFAAPGLMAGNAGVLKHASNVPGCALAIEAIFRDAGFPPALLRALLIGSDLVEGALDDRRVVAATLTGSTGAGRAVASAAGQRLKKTVLELGGSDPYVVLEDADLEAAVEACVTSRLINSGQSCIAAKRFIVVDAVHDAFVEAFIDAMRARTLGDPMDPDTDVGPQASVALRDALHDQVTRSVAQGAALRLGGEVPERAGAWYPPTVLTGVRPGMAAHDEETFGPVAAVVRARDEADAVRLANASCFGLGAAVFTADLDRGRRIAERELEAGCCFVNAFVTSDPRLPFGGIKDSGYGRELSSQGIRAFCNTKTVYVAGDD